MNRLLLPLLLLSLSGCVNVPVGTPAPVVNADVKNIAPFVTQLAQTAVPLILNKNKAYAPVIASVATAIPAAFSQGNLDATSISNTVALIGKGNGLDAVSEAAISTVLLDAVTYYQSAYGVKVASATDPNVVTLLIAFSVGLQNGVTTWQNSQPKS
jgi:hypothetical protein